MSDRNNSDNQNTNTMYIPPETKSRQPMRKLQRTSKKPSSEYDLDHQYGERPYQGQYQGHQYGERPYQGQYQGQQYGERPYQSQYQGQQYGERPYQGQYQGQQYGERPYQGQYQGQQYGERPYQGQYQEQQRSRSYDDIDVPPPHPKKKSSGKKKKKKRKKTPVIIRVLLILLILFVLVFGAYSCTALSLIKKMDHVDTGSRNRRSDALVRSNVTNILVIGTDGRTETERGRSDTVMMISINKSTKKMSLISFMRDCYVEIPGSGWDKLNASYSYGGAELLMDTIEHNFGIQIDDYVSVNFISFANIVDSIGGIDIEVSDAEAEEINTILQAEVNEIMGDDRLDDLLTGGGKLHLNGKQALSYARIRHIGNADFERTERQRRVMELVMGKAKSVKPSMMAKLSTNVLPGVTTNMSTAELYALSLKAPFMLGYEKQQLQVPAEGTYYGQSTPSGDALIVDFEANFNKIYETAYEN